MAGSNDVGLCSDLENNFLRVTEIVQTIAPRALQHAFPRAWLHMYPDVAWDDSPARRLEFANLIRGGRPDPLRRLPFQVSWRANTIGFLDATGNHTGADHDLRIFFKRGDPVDLRDTVDGATLLPADTRVDLVNAPEFDQVTRMISRPSHMKIQSATNRDGVQHRGDRGAARVDLFLFAPSVRSARNTAAIDNPGAKRKLEQEGYTQWDVSMLSWALCDEGHRLISPSSDVYDKIKAVHDVRNQTWGHAIGGKLDDGSFTNARDRVSAAFDALIAEQLLTPDEAVPLRDEVRPPLCHLLANRERRGTASFAPILTPPFGYSRWTAHSARDNRLQQDADGACARPAAKRDGGASEASTDD